METKISMEFKNIEALIKIVSESNLTTFEMEQEGTKLVLKKDTINAVLPQNVCVQPSVINPQPEVVTNPVQNIKVENPVSENVTVSSEVKEGQFVKSPMVGTFYASGAPDKPPFVKVGDKVKKGQVVCIVEAMKLMNEIESTVDGEIVEILVNNEDMVEFGQKLFVIK